MKESDHENYNSTLVKRIRLLHDVGFGALGMLVGYAKTESFLVGAGVGLLAAILTELIVNPICWKVAEKSKDSSNPSN